MRQQIFYHHGLRFQCQPACAACCKISGKVRVTESEISRMAKLLGMSETAFKKTYVNETETPWILKERADGACAMLDEQDRCRVHAERPGQCRSYPFWPEILANEFTWILEKQICPGLDVGEHYPRRRIEKILKGEDEAGGFPPEPAVAE